jgi:hypothetical protein
LRQTSKNAPLTRLSRVILSLSARSEPFAILRQPFRILAQLTGFKGTMACTVASTLRISGVKAALPARSAQRPQRMLIRASANKQTVQVRDMAVTRPASACRLSAAMID